MVKDELEAMYASVRKVTASTHSIMLGHRPVKDTASSDSTEPAPTPKRKPSRKRRG